MKNLFNIDNPVIQFLARVGDMILTNVLFLICCIPIVTIGASIAGLNKVMQDAATDGEKGVFKTFFGAFRDNFKQATVAWLAIVLFLGGMVCYFLLVATYFEGTLATVANVVLAILVVIVLAIGAYLFPLMVRYDNTLKEHVLNAGILAVIKLPRTVAIVFLTVLPFLIFFVSVTTFFSTLVFWLCIGFAFCAFLSSLLLVKVFAELEDPKGTGNMKVMG